MHMLTFPYYFYCLKCYSKSYWSQLILVEYVAVGGIDFGDFFGSLDSCTVGKYCQNEKRAGKEELHIQRLQALATGIQQS